MIRIENLSKAFKKHQVLKNIDLELENGSVTALIGPNGSGKTTLLKSILGLIQIDSGKIYLNNQILDDDHSENRREIGYMPQKASFPENLSVDYVIEMIQNLRDNPQNLDKELIDLFDFDQEMQKNTGILSGGNRQKLSAIIAFMFNPSVIILDEPTAGLDPVSSRIFKNKILEEKKRGKTIIITSHILADVDELADHMVFILNGSVYIDEKISFIKSKHEESNLEKIVAKVLKEAN